MWGSSKQILALSKLNGRELNPVTILISAEIQHCLLRLHEVANLRRSDDVRAAAREVRAARSTSLLRAALAPPSPARALGLAPVPAAAPARPPGATAVSALPLPKSAAAALIGRVHAARARLDVSGTALAQAQARRSTPVSACASASAAAAASLQQVPSRALRSIHAPAASAVQAAVYSRLRL
ncbi:Protein of unknown function [Gryllus bimaculatus]|nr:Protein of unknown function [Gryllus bimaculatus]